MAQKKAFVRYAQNKAVPGSLIVRTKAPKVGTWKEVPYDVCCNNVCESVGPFIFTLSEVPEDFGAGTGIRLSLNCGNCSPSIPSACAQGIFANIFGLLSVPVTSPTISEVVDLINTTFIGQGITAQLVEGVLQVTVSNTNYITNVCIGSYLSVEVEIFVPA
jgi:hypothetical protein